MNKNKRCRAAFVGIVFVAAMTSACGGGDGGASQPGSYSVSGSVSGATAGNVLLELSGHSSATTTSAPDGSYSFTGLTSGSYTIRPSKTGYTFAPASTPVSVSGSSVGGQNFTATSSASHAISGRVSGVVSDGVLITLGGGATGTTTTAGGGLYSFTGLVNGSYTIAPSKAAYTFSPSSTLVGVNGASVGGQDFTSSAAPTYSITGTVSGAATDGVLMTLNGDAFATTTTALGGAFSLSGLASGSYTLTPSKAGYTFSPPNSSFSVSSASISGKDFVATASGGASCSVDNWCQQSSLLGTAVLGGVWGSNAGDIWAVGTVGTIVRWNGSVWSSVPGGPSFGLNGVWGSGPNDVWVVGASGTVVHWDGGAWATKVSGTSEVLNGVWGTSSSNAWAVGGNGVILHWNGSAWSTVTSGVTVELRSVWGASANDVWAVGFSGVILHWNGSAWSSVTASSARLYGVWGISTSDVWAVGDLGTTLHWDGSSWSSVASSASKRLYSVWGSSTNDVWAVGVGGTIVHWNGSGWSSKDSGTPSGLNCVWGSGAGDVWTVAAVNNILEHRP